MSTELELEPGVVIAARFRVLERLPTAGSREAFRALETGTDQRVVLFRLTEEEARALVPGVGLEHAHLARIVALPELEDGTVALACEDVDGPRLDLVLDEMGHETPVEAVRSALRVADALSALHKVGAAHGFLHPGSVIVAPDGRKPPLLTFAPPPDPPSAFRSSAGAPAPSVADDTWGMTALFHYMLVGHAPPSSGFEDEAPLEAAGVADPVLRAALLHGLHADPTRRSQDLTPLRRELARWYVDRAGDESSGPIKLSNPPPLPGASESPPFRNTQRARAPERRRSRRLMLGVVAVFVLALGVAWALSSLRSPTVQVVEVNSATSAPSQLPSGSQSAGDPRIDLGEVSVTSDAGAADETAQCVSELLPEGTFGRKLPDFRWLCAEPDALDGAQRLRSALVAGRPPGSLTDAMRIMGQLTWYELPLYAVVYRACCPEAPRLKLPDPGPGCPRLDDTLEQVASDVLSERAVDATLAQLAAAIDCETKASRAAAFRQASRPRSKEEPAFREFLKSLR